MSDMPHPTTEGYILTATLGSVSEQVELVGHPDDDSATMEAIFIIMDNAYEDKTGPWALGSITLADTAGNVIQTMAAK